MGGRRRFESSVEWTRTRPCRCIAKHLYIDKHVLLANRGILRVRCSRLANVDHGRS